jgi:MAF protein
VEKARWVAALHGDSALILAADTSVVDNDQILGKPVDFRDAEQMLRKLRGRCHKVYSGIGVIWKGKIVTDLCKTDVPIRNYSDKEIQEYIKTGNPLDKAGAYAIQHPDFHPVEHLEGCYANVMGLPLCHLTRAMMQVGIKVKKDIPVICQDYIRYKCQVFHQII